jgi:predicted metal-dependent phosphoesterase TrpH
MPTAGVADLHVHTTASDGTSSLAERFTQAAARDLPVLAITDHDNIGGALDGRVDRRDDVTCITGVEIRADCVDTKVELLGYFVDPTADQMSAVLRRARRYRVERNRKLLAKLNEAAGLELDHEELSASVQGGLGRPHVAKALVEEGIVASIGAAFDEYLGRDGPAYVEMERVPARAVLDAIHAAGGVASLAHPGRIHSDRVPEIVARLAAQGLDGIEVWYPYDDGSSPTADTDVGVAEADALATEHDLLRTGGSDCHGPASGKFRLGSVRVPADDLEALFEAAGLEAPV